MRTVIGAICVFASSVHAATLAYVDSRDRLVYQPEGGKPVVVSRDGYEPSLRRDGKQLLYTRQESATSPKRTLVLYDVASGHSSDLISGFVSGPVWSPDGRRMAFTRLEAKVWQVWVMDLAEPAKASRVSEEEMDGVAGWSPESDTIICYNQTNVYWIGLDGKTRRKVPTSVFYRQDLEWMSSNKIRIDPKNPNLLAVSAGYSETQEGAPADETGMTFTVALFDINSSKRDLVLTKKVWGDEAEWSPDGEWLYFRRLEARGFAVWRVHPDGSGLERVAAGSGPAVAE